MAKNGALPVAGNDFYKTNGLSDTATYFDGPSMTRQEFADECDINNLMRRFENHDIGAIMRQSAPPEYFDFTTVPGNLMETLAVFDDAQAAFMTLPASVRREFDNSPHLFTDFAVNPANLDQMRTWGLAPMPPPQPAGDPTAVPPPPPVVPPG